MADVVADYELVERPGETETTGLFKGQHVLIPGRLRAVLGGERGPARDIVCLNAAAALVVADAAADLREGAARAAAAIDGGAAVELLARLVAFTDRHMAAGRTG